jgi:hypothetical protein
MPSIILTERQLDIITSEVLNEKETLNESLFSFENILMAAGFVPVIGEVADIALICYYLYKGEKLYAALMLIALIPTVGDFIAKPIIRLFKGSKEASTAMKAGGKTLTDYLAKNPQIAKKYSSLAGYVKAPVVEKTVQSISKVNSSLGSKLSEGLNMIAGGSKAVSGIKAGSKEVISGGLFKTGLKDYYQKQTLSKYFAKNNVIPEKGIKKWWINVSARQDRRNSFRKFIGANNLLAYFGIPSLTTFERKMSEDEEFRKKIAEDPKTSDYIAQNYEKEDTVVNQNNSSQQQTSQNNSNSSQGSDQIQNFLSKTFGKGLNDALSFN